MDVIVQNLPSEPPSPWTLTESLGDSALVLKRPFNSEEIIVTVIADEVTLQRAFLNSLIAEVRARWPQSVASRILCFRRNINMLYCKRAILP
jgi:hypothetical protein